MTLGRRLKSLARCWIGVMAATVGCTTTPSVELAPRPSFFIQMSDPQFGFFTANADFVRETANFEKAIAIANRLRPAFVVVTGDLVHRVGDAPQIAEYLRIARTLDPGIPLYNVAGNHDVGQIPTPELLVAYRVKFGPDRYAFERGGVVGIVLNSSLIKDPSGAPDEAAAQERWLRGSLDSLRRAGGANIVVFQHHSWFLTDPDEPDQYYNLPLERRRAYLALFGEYGIAHVFAGHYHRNAQGQSTTLAMVTSGPVGRPMGADPSGLRIVEVNGRAIRHRYYALDSVPASSTVSRCSAGSPSFAGVTCR